MQRCGRGRAGLPAACEGPARLLPPERARQLRQRCASRSHAPCQRDPRASGEVSRPGMKMLDCYARHLLCFPALCASIRPARQTCRAVDFFSRSRERYRPVRRTLDAACPPTTHTPHSTHTPHTPHCSRFYVATVLVRVLECPSLGKVVFISNKAASGHPRVCFASYQCFSV